MTEVLARKVRELLAGEGGGSMFRCSECGSFLDAPRVNPLTDCEGRKCLSCHDWQPVVFAARPPDEPGSGNR